MPQPRKRAPQTGTRTRAAVSGSGESAVPADDAETPEAEEAVAAATPRPMTAAQRQALRRKLQEKFH